MFKHGQFVIRRNFRQYILIAGLQLSIPPVILLSTQRLSSIVCRRSSIVYHQSSIYQFIFIRHCHVYVGDWSTLAACWHSTCLVLRRGVVTSAAAVCDACRHPSPCSVAGTGLLVTTWRRLSPVCVIVDEGCDCCQASTSWTSVLSSLCYWFDQCS